MATTKRFETITKKDKNGGIRIWSAQVVSIPEGGACSIVSYGLKGGKMQTATVTYTKGKNIGKTNETTPFMQACLETERKWLDKQQKEHFYIENEDLITEVGVNVVGEEITEQMGEKRDHLFITPMLAKCWSPDKPQTGKNISFPCYVQPKLDGLRCLTYMKDGRVYLQTRTGGHFVGLTHIEHALFPILSKYPFLVLDGELYTDQIPFEELVGVIRKQKRSESDIEKVQKVEYHVYDLYNRSHPTVSFEFRHKFLNELFNDEIYAEHGTECQIIEVKTFLVKSVEEVKDYFSQFIEEGYEGIMLRNKQAPYQPNVRSFHLQKYKEFMEEEFRIIGFTSGVGRFEGAVIWICETSDGQSFHVVPRGSLEFKRGQYQNGDSYIGKLLTVIFQQKMESGIPRFPVGKAIREE